MVAGRSEADTRRPAWEGELDPSRALPGQRGRPWVIGTGGNYADHAAEAIQAIQVSEPVFMPFLRAIPRTDPWSTKVTFRPRGSGSR